jgi:hypothetical protein
MILSAGGAGIETTGWFRLFNFPGMDISGFDRGQGSKVLSMYITG